ncbi:MAG TPA: hypothetical protein EYH40_02970 [Desulfurococcales archaeon]|nr:hypothetical protein [Desulfurococcales archaeon]
MSYQIPLGTTLPLFDAKAINSLDSTLLLECLRVGVVEEYSIPYEPLRYLGILLVILGLLLILTPYIVELILKTGKGRIHPLIYYPIYRGDGFTLGISPVVFIVLILLYILFATGKFTPFR